ncbi:MAG: hypothetical protein KF819_26860 [Labilithrix sp.]|nr:hypothetical protein [Labilithrix sp.]
MRRVFALVLASSLALGATMCSSDPSSPPDGDSGGLADGRFRGVFAGSGDLAGTAEVTIQSGDLRPQAAGGASQYSVTGTVTLNIPGVGPITVDGTLDLATSAVTLSGVVRGAPLTFTGRYEGGRIRGDLTTPAGTGPLVLTNEELGGLRVHCGTFDGALRGRWNLLVAGGRVNVVFASSEGQVGTGEGPLEDRLAAITLVPSGSATATEASGQFTGSWVLADPERRGSFAASEAACAALVPSNPGADGGANDGGADAGPPGVPEVVIDRGGTVRVGHVAVSGTRIIYSLDHPYFTQKREIAAVGGDGSAPATLVPVNAEPENGVAGLSVMAGKVFWTTNGTATPGSGLFSVAVTGGAVASHGLVSSSELNDDYVAGIYRMVNDGSTLFISSYGASGTSIRSFDASGAPAATFDETVVGTLGMAVDGADLLFGELTGLRRAPKTLASASTLLSAREDYGEFDTLLNIVSDADFVYFVTRELNAAKLWRRPKGGGPIVAVMAPAPKQPRGLALVDGYLYLVLATQGGQGPGGSSELVRIAKTANNGTPTTVGPANFHDVVTDGTYVYYGEGTRLRRVHK